MSLQFCHSSEVLVTLTASCVLFFVRYHLNLSVEHLLADCASHVGHQMTFQTLLCCQHFIACRTNTWFAVLVCYVKHQLLLRHAFQFAAFAGQVHDLDMALEALFIAEGLLAHGTLPRILRICFWMFLIHVSLQP